MINPGKVTRGFRLASVARFLVGFLFIFAGVTKLGNPTILANSIAGFELLPAFMIMPLALWLPFLEIVPGCACLFMATARPALLLISGLTSVFLVAIVLAILRGLEVNCGCFGAQEWLVSSPPIAALRNIVIIALSVWAYLDLRKPSPNQR